jgi:hypothetical protein
MKYLGRVQRMQTMIEDKRNVTKEQRDEEIKKLYRNVDDFVSGHLNNDDWEFQHMLRLTLSTREATDAYLEGGKSKSKGRGGKTRGKDKSKGRLGLGLRS